MFQQDTEFTPVIFRKYGARKGGAVIALFAAELGTYDPYTCSSYVHVGQHGSADPRLVMKDTRQALPHEYADLKQELESAPYGYRLKVYQRLHPMFVVERKRQLRQLRPTSMGLDAFGGPRPNEGVALSFNRERRG